ncbi:MAG: hypothetical protein SO024_08175 [Collinsella sp.]|nr:hypothetical protein [Collinsella sp.]
MLLYSPAHDGGHIKWPPVRAELATNLTPTPLTRRATVVGLITDTIKPLAYRLLAWHGTILAALIHELVELLMAESRAERKARRALIEAAEGSEEKKSSKKSSSIMMRTIRARSHPPVDEKEYETLVA